MNGVGNNGYSWSAATRGIYGQDLLFKVTWLYPNFANDSRAYGFQLRCLSE
ncbi:hypothetical protein [uncultured Rikenella sp.]|uniref:hypothetical protein n=1 Tax=uncultured Rikenella sp. TaxID=368003 RepID=UPI0025F2E081|nr:hypothetical protein [uncultured Rikenella sp.]